MSATITAATPAETGADAVQLKSWLPTRKWLAGVITAVGAFVILWIQTGGFGREVQIALAGLVTQAVVAYVVPNQDGPGGVPLKRG
jgi:hypothetical protein